MNMWVKTEYIIKTSQNFKNKLKKNKKKQIRNWTNTFADVQEIEVQKKILTLQGLLGGKEEKRAEYISSSMGLEEFS